MRGARVVAVTGMLALAGCSAVPSTSAGIAEPSATASTPPPATPSPTPDPEIPDCPADVETGIDSTVSAQLEAFSAGDFRSAFALASESFQASIDLKGFREVIRTGYPEVADSVDHRLLECRQPDPMRASALVAVTGENGMTAQLGYRFVLEPDGWRIDGASTLATAPVTTA